MSARMKWGAVGLAALVLILGLGKLWRLRHRPQVQAAGSQERLYTGKEAKRKVRLLFPAADKPGFAEESAEIYASASELAQVKQVLRLLFKGPAGAKAAKAFPAEWRYREVFLTDKGLAVVDLDAAGVAAQSGGTSGEYIELYGMVKALCDNFKDIKQVQFLVAGQARESLAGHMDISDPLSPTDF